MSDMLNHYCCGREAFEALPENSAVNAIIYSHFDAYRLGTQGPDFFYYHHPMPWNDLKALHHYGNRIHQKNIDAFFYYGLMYAFTNPKDRDIIISYLAGFTCHHSLDVATHPYIFYFTGHYDPQIEGSRIYSYYHKYFEVLLDVAHYQYEYQKLGCFAHLEKIFSPEKATLEVLERFYNFIMVCVYGEPVMRGCVSDTLKDTAELVRLFSDPNSMKKHFFEKIEAFIGEERLVSRVFYPLYTNEFRVLNLDNSEWKHPCTGESSHLSYPQLFSQAVDETVRKLALMDQIIENNAPTPAMIHQMYGNTCYDRALPCASSLEMTHFDIIFEKNPQL
ncbi:MAG: zinc dependent phospholipase C family protein [Eubacterium sp.]